MSMEKENCGYFSDKIEVGVASDPQFNVISHLEGPYSRNLHYIQDQCHCRLSVHGSANTGESEDIPLHILVIADAEEDLEKARGLCSDLISTVKTQKQRAAQVKAAKRVRKKKNGKGSINLPDALIAAMRVYFPGQPVEPPPPGSAEDAREHRTHFRSVGKELNWFTQV